MVPFSNGRREGANPSSRVIILPSLEFLNYFVEHASRGTDHTRTEKVGGDSIIFVVIQVERETVMTAW